MKQLPKMPYGEGSMSYRGEKIEYRKRIKLPDNSFKSKTVYGSTPQECMKKMREAEKQLLKNNIPQSKEILCDAMYSWLNNTKKNTLKTQSYQRLESTIRNQIEPSSIGHDKYQQITSDELQQVIQNMIENNYSHSSIKKVYDALNAFYKFASERYDFKNPMTTVVMPKKAIITVEEKDIEWLKEEDINKFISTSKLTYKNGNIRYPYGRILSANIYLGLRCGELLALQWKDIDLEKNTIYVCKTLIQINDSENHKVKFEIQDSNKTSQNRYVPINSKAKELLLEHKKISQYTEPEDYVISTRNRKTNTIKNMADSIKAIEIMANTSIQSGSTHTLRHTCASLYFKAGVPIETIAKILGHDVEVCRKTYIHFVEEQLKNAASLIVPVIEI